MIQNKFEVGQTVYTTGVITDDDWLVTGVVDQIHVDYDGIWYSIKGKTCWCRPWSATLKDCDLFLTKEGAYDQRINYVKSCIDKYQQELARLEREKASESVNERRDVKG